MKSLKRLAFAFGRLMLVVAGICTAVAVVALCMGDTNVATAAVTIGIPADVIALWQGFAILK